MIKILVEHGECGQLAKLFKVSRRSVYNALNNNTESVLSDRIRKAAIQRGGAEVDTQPKQKIS